MMIDERYLYVNKQEKEINRKTVRVSKKKNEVRITVCEIFV
jgi:hypothetical protein